MPPRRRAPALAIALLLLGACATVRPTPLSGPVRDVIPRVGDREVMLTDRSGRDIRMTYARLRNDSVVGISIETGRPVALAADDVQKVKVFGDDPVTSVASTYGVGLLLIGAAALLALIAHSTGR